MSKRWVIPDVHGCINTLKALVENQIKPSKYDWLFFLGDYIDRGPDSKGVIDYLMHLQKEEYNLRLIRGNHEDYLSRLYANENETKKLFGISISNKLKKEWYKHGGKETLRSFNINDPQKIPQKYISWMKDLEYYVELDDCIMVHAGFNFDAHDPFLDTHSMMWIKEFSVDQKLVKGKKIIHGHVPVSIDFIQLMNNTRSFNFIDLDNGIYIKDKAGFGKLVALEINSRELLIQENVDL